MTKRDKQATEYAAESYEKTYEKQGDPHMSGACPHVRGTVTQHCSLNFTLTDEEREAVEWYAAYGAGHHADTLRNLLERLK